MTLKILQQKQTYGLKLKISKASSKFHKNTKKIPKREKNQNKVKQIKPKLKKQNSDLTLTLRNFSNLAINKLLLVFWFSFFLSSV